MAVLFRQSMLLNGILCNSEVLYGVNKDHIEMLESVDRYFWRKIFQCPITTPTEIFFMETSCTPVRFILMKRRLMYYWNILQMTDDELVKRVFLSQRISPCKNDWVLQIDDDMRYCKIDKSDDEIKKMKKYSFKKLINEKIRNITNAYLLELRDDPSRSKSKKFYPSEELKDYLKSNELTTEEKQLLFLMKSRMTNLKWNFKGKYKNDMNCSLCKLNFVESETHLLQCDQLTCEPGLVEEMKKIQYDDIFGTLSEQIQAVKIWKKIFKMRAKKLEERKLSFGHQEHLQSASLGCSNQQREDPTHQDCASLTPYLQLLYQNDLGY